MQDKAGQFAQKAPPLSQKEKDGINALFPTYIFRRSRTSEIWTTCCHKHTMVSDRDMMVRTPERDFLSVMWEPHQREPKNQHEDSPKPNVQCPFCGKKAIVKELGRTGRRDNLSCWRRAVVLRWHRGALWARAYDCGKHYNDDSLTGEPDCNLIGVYRFKPGLAESTTRYFYGNYPFSCIQRQDKPLTKGRWNIHGPFRANADYGVGYSVIGLDEVQKSPFRYCMAEEAEWRFTKFLEYLTACCFYPRQIEMLMKAGMCDVVRDLAERGVKHAAVINWDEENPAKAFRLDRREMKTFLNDTVRDIRILELHKKLKGRVPLTECKDWITNYVNIQETFREAKKWNLPPEKLMRYLNGDVGCASYGGMRNMDSALRHWKDYLTAAEALGYQLHKENVLLPRNLGVAHDSATAKHQSKLERERKKAQTEKDRLAALAYDERRVELEKKYGFTMDGYVIMVPHSKDEILDEGRKLKHCVGGYADRHMQGITTILFMRKASKPNEPWLTIEMDGIKMRQIHGFRNEGEYTVKGRFAPDPREVYREFLDAWLDWLKNGSKRGEDGKPKLPRKKGAAFRNFFINMWDGIKSAVSKVGDFIVNVFQERWENVKRIWGNASEFFGGIWGSIKETFSSSFDEFKTVGRDMIEGLWQVFLERVQWLSDQITGFISNIVDGVKGLLGIRSPSRVFAGIGENMAAGLGEGWDSEFDRIKNQIEDGLDFGTASVGIESRGSYGLQGPAYGGAGSAANANQPQDIVINLTAELDGSVLARKMVRHNARAEALVGESLVVSSRQ